ncbi:hypothetical protein F5148DRAFT_1161655 [Russula earlei]|uniref:Uncharacterized protein n=1 Tax=Russula earlei TaxID=71964 RepID=A0ACC0ULR1_9AGAM|nr:hypothetical protein F5148DRAFT_1161655 [Russula earlei]
MRLTGKLFTLRRDVVLGRNVLDVPSIFWEEASMHGLDTIGHRMPASTSKARKVMQWFCSCSKGHRLDDDGEASVPLGRKPSDCDRSESTILPPKKPTMELQELEMLNRTRITNLL